jgi:hypothetical protein
MSTRFPLSTSPGGMTTSCRPPHRLPAGSW